jgi:WD40 repeat protein
VAVVAFSPDGGSVLVAGRPRPGSGTGGDPVAVVGEVGTVLSIANALNGSPVAVAVERKGKRSAVADGKRVTVFERGKTAATFNDRANLSAIVWPDDTIVTGDGAGLVSLWNPAALGDATTDIDTTQKVVGLAVHPSDPRSFFVAGDDGAIRVVDTARSTPGPVAAGAIANVAVATGQGGKLAVGGLDATPNSSLATWDGTGAANKLTSGLGANAPKAIGMSGDGSLVAWAVPVAGTQSDLTVSSFDLTTTVMNAGPLVDADVSAILPLPGTPILIAVGHASGKMDIVNAKTKTISATKNAIAVVAMAPHPNLTSFYVADTDPKLRLRDADLAVVTEVKLPSAFPDIRLLATSKTYLAVGTETGKVFIWPHGKIDQNPTSSFADPGSSTGKAVTSLTIVEDPAAPENAFVVAGLKDGKSLFVFDVKAQKPRQSINISPAIVVGLAGSDPKAGALVSTNAKNLQAVPVNVVRVIIPSGTGKLSSMTSDDESVYAGFDDGSIQSIDGSGVATPYTPTSTKKVVALASAGTGAGRTLYALHDGEAKLRSGKTASAKLDAELTLTAPADSLALLAGGRFVALSSSGSEVAILDLASSSTTPVLSLFGSTGYGLLAPTVDNRGLIAASDAEKSAAVWRVLNPAQGLLSNVAKGSRIHAGAWLGDTHVVLGGDDSVRILDLNGNEAFKVARTKPVLAVAASLEANCITAGGNDKVITVWQKDLTMPRTFTPPASPATTPPTSDVINTLAFDSASKRLASGSGTTVAVWDLATGTLSAKENLVHKKAVKSVAFSKNGQFLASLGADGTLVVWDVTVAGALTKVKSVDAPGYLGHQVTWLDDGGTLVVGASDGNVHAFTFTP